MEKNNIIFSMALHLIKKKKLIFFLLAFGKFIIKKKLIMKTINYSKSVINFQEVSWPQSRPRKIYLLWLAQPQKSN